MTPIVVDAHEDIAWNVLTFGRDYSKNVAWLRSHESGTTIPAQNGNATLSLGEWLAGRVAVIFATLFVSPARRRMGDWDTQSYSTQQEAHRNASDQLDFYKRLADDQPVFRIISTKSDLSAVLNTWKIGAPPSGRKIGLLPLMEGADPILEPEQVEDWFIRGVRVVGPAWESTRYAGGTHEPGPLTSDGHRLLEIMGELSMILDLSHLAEQAYDQALDMYAGSVIATHANPRHFLPTSRGLSDDMILRLAERDGVIGIVPYNRFLMPGWDKNDPKDRVTIAKVVAAIDYVCQLVGSDRHVGLGSDFDGGFGREHIPAEMDNVSDLLKLEPLLAEKGYTPTSIANILGDNWLRVLQQALPA